PNGGLAPANTYPENNDGGIPNETPGVIDFQAPRLAYTVNEAICPRGILVPGFRDAKRPYRFVRASQVRNPSGTILATELWGSAQSVLTASLVGGSTPVSASR